MEYTPHRSAVCNAPYTETGINHILVPLHSGVGAPCSFHPAWVTRDGKYIEITKMTTSHIRNCINKIHRSGDKWRKQYLNILELELYRREERLKYYLA